MEKNHFESLGGGGGGGGGLSVKLNIEFGELCG